MDAIIPEPYEIAMKIHSCIYVIRLASVSQLDVHPTGDQEIAGLSHAELATFFRGN